MGRIHMHETSAATRTHHPVVVEHAARRAASGQLRIADSITAFAGSMPFVYLHTVLFAGWMLFVESDPWPRLTLIVSLEAIFLSTFVMIGQNRQAEFQRAKADHDFTTGAHELHANTELDARDPHADDRDPPARHRRRDRTRVGTAPDLISGAPAAGRAPPADRTRTAAAVTWRRFHRQSRPRRLSPNRPGTSESTTPRGREAVPGR